MMLTIKRILFVVFLRSLNSYALGDIAPAAQEGEVTLYGENGNKGTVLIYYNNTWGSICDDGWGPEEAAVICRQLGFTGNQFIAHTNSYYGSGIGTVVLDDVYCIGTEDNITQCAHNPWEVSNCDHNEDAGVDCDPASEASRYPIKLVWGSNEREGQVRVFFKGYWGSVCDDGWDDHAAQVACRQLNFTGVISLPTTAGYFSDDPTYPVAPIMLDDIQCKGSETSLAECNHRPWMESNCRPEDNAGVICLIPPQEGENLHVRLAGGINKYQGRVEIQVYGRWGTICSHNFGPEDAQVVCRMLGYEGGANLTSHLYQGGGGPIWLDDIGCQGSESNLMNCSRKPWGVNDCTHMDDAAVSCTAPGGGDHVISYLEGGSSKGRLIVTVNGVQGVICNHNVTNAVAMVVCNELGLNTTNPIITPVKGGLESPAVLDNVVCMGTEQTLAGCRYDKTNVVCQVEDQVGVDCQVGYSGLVVALKPRTGQPPWQGTVQLQYNNTWGTICDDYFDVNDARVICNQLGYNSSVPLAVGSAVFGMGDGPIWIDDLECTGTESDVTNCRHSAYGVHHCTHNEDAGVVCTPGNLNDITGVRLAGPSIGEGRVEVFFNNTGWGTVCDDRFSNEAASVVCRMLGFNPNGAVARATSYYGAGSYSMRVLLDEVDCRGDETNLFQCASAPIGTSDCHHTEDVGVLCPTPVISAAALRARLVNGSSTSEGRLEVSFNGSWSTVCSHSFGQTEAKVACRMLGFNSPGAEVLGSEYFGPGQGAILLDDVRCSGIETNLMQCGNKGYYNHDCTHASDVGIMCNPLPVAVRLAGTRRTRYDRGRVEIQVNGNWGTVCDDYFDNRAARVVCAQLRYPSLGAMVVNNAPFGEGNGPILLDDVICTGNESSIMDCEHNLIGNNNCDHSEDVGVICSDVTPSSGTMRARLAGSSATEGRLEIAYSGQWGTVCDDYFSDLDAKVACAMLGIGGGNPRMLPVGTYPGGVGIVWLDDVDCLGNETNLDNCRHRQLGTSNCEHAEDVAIACGPLAATPTQIRLAGTNYSTQGRVEVLHNGYWGTLCDDMWGIKEAYVVCRQLGFPSSVVAVPLANAYFGAGTGQIWLDQLDCLGNETNIDSCSHKPFGYNDCEHSEDASVFCFPPTNTPSPFALRLSGGASMYEGRVEVRYNGIWGTVCDDNFDKVDAQVVCRTLGYSGGNLLEHVGTGKGAIWMDDVGCQGSEATLDLCPFNGWGEHDCDHKEDVGVSCENPAEMDLQVRLQNGGGPGSGRVEVLYNGQWGTVCDTGFDDNAAAVICRQLGYNTGTAQAFNNSHFGPAPDEYHNWVSGMKCVGAEQRMGLCNISMNVDSCDSTHQAGVACNGGLLPIIPVRLVGGGNSYEGRVEINVNGTWGTVCDDYWDQIGATVICRMLGLPSLSVLARTGGYFVSNPPAKIWLDDVRCAGWETSIAQCAHAAWGVSNCLHSEDAGVVCGGSVTRSPLRLVGGLTPQYGRVEVFHNNSWGTVCDDNFETDEAAVVCKSLGFPTIGARAFPRAYYGAGTGQIWLDDVSCSGYEAFLDSCAYRPWGHSNCLHNEDVSVSCGGAISSVGVRLVGSTNSYEGRVELQVNGTWGTVCSDRWSTADAMVVCAMMGFSRSSAQIVVDSRFGDGSGPIWMSEVQCFGFEESLLNCRSKIIGQISCSHRQDAAVICSGTSMKIRLVPGPDQGRLEVQTNTTTWGSVCDSGMEGPTGQAVALVVCRQLNQPFSGAYAVTHGRLGVGSGPAVLDSLSCTGGENYFGQCRHNPVGIVRCQPTQILGVVCASATTTTMATSPSTTPAPIIDYVTLTGYITAYSGRLQVFHNNTWGTVCNHNWTNQDASVVCRMLGYSGENATALLNPLQYQAGSGMIWMDNVQCSGSEGNIGACSFAGWGGTTCTHSQDVGVSCAPGQLPDNFLLFTDSHNKNLYRMDMSSFSFITVPLLGHASPFAVDYDYINHRVYWTDIATKKILSAKPDASLNETVLALGPDASPEGLALDPLSGLLFYTDSGSDIIALVTFSGHERKVVISTGLEQPRPIVLDTMNGIMFWADWGSVPKIERANYDGSSRMAIVTGSLTWPNALALDLPNQRIFWVDSSENYDDKLEYSDLFGDKRTVIYSEPQTHFVGMALYDKHIYLTDWQASALKRLETDGTNVVTIGPATFGYINDVVVHVEGGEPQGPNGCTANRNCSRICVPNVGSGFQCLCPDGMFLQPDNYKCDTKATCLPLAAPQHGTISPASCSSGPSLSGATCTLACGTGFTLTVSPIVSCLSGLWNIQTNPTICRDDQPPSIQCPKNVVVNAAKGNISATVTWPPPTASDNSGNVSVIVSMTSPIVLSEGSYNITATGFDGVGLSATCTFSASVVVQRCQPFSAARFSRLVTSPCPTHYGATCQVMCLPGYQMPNGSSMAVVTCGSSYMWTYPAPCNPITCPALTAPTHGSVTPSSCLKAGTAVGSNCSITCEYGFKITSGSPMLACMTSGQWDYDGILAICTDAQPPTVVCPKNVTAVVSSGKTTASVTWASPTAQDNSGNDQVLVTSSITSGVTLAEGQYTVLVTATDKAGNIASCSFSVTVTVRRCPKFQIPSNGVLLTPNCQTILGSTCSIACRTGYTLSGNSDVTCSLNGQQTAWNALPVCNLVTCQTPQPPANGVMAECPIRPPTVGSTCKQTCKSGYVLSSGSPIRTCQSDGTWTGTIGSCTPQQSTASAMSQQGNAGGNNSGSSNTSSVVAGTVVGLILLALILAGGFLFYKRRILGVPFFRPWFVRLPAMQPMSRISGPTPIEGLDNPLYDSLS